MKDVLIVHYNTPELTDAVVKSLLKHTSDCSITVFDNSDIKPFVNNHNVRVIDNTNSQEIDFDSIIDMFPYRRKSDNRYGSAKHCYSVDYCFKFFNDGFLLLDSDALVKTDVSKLFDYSKIWVGQPHKSHKHTINIERLYPFCCFINTKMCREHKVKYFDGNHMWQLSEDFTGVWYDTGAWFLSETRHLPHTNIMVNDYIAHYGNGSFNNNKKESVKDWLKRHEDLYK